MKKSELRQLIKEELKNVVEENNNESIFDFNTFKNVGFKKTLKNIETYVSNLIGTKIKIIKSDLKDSRVLSYESKPIQTNIKIFKQLTVNESNGGITYNKDKTELFIFP